MYSESLEYHEWVLARCFIDILLSFSLLLLYFLGNRMVGPAILYLPHGLATSGYAFAIPIMLLATFLFLFSCQCLLESWKLEHSRLLRQVQAKQRRRESPPNGKERNTIIDEGSGDEEQDERNTEHTALLDTTNTCTTDELHHHQRTFFLSYPELAYRALGVRFEQLVKLGITLMQSCVCLTYLIFVPQNLSSAVHLLCNVQIAPEWFLIVMIAVQVPLSWIRDIRKLTVTNLLANVLILYGLIVCVALALKQATSITTGMEGQDGQVTGHIQTIVKRFESLTPFGKDWFLFIGTAVSAKFQIYWAVVSRNVSKFSSLCSFGGCNSLLHRTQNI